jgi:undecaprenyl-diphosphatase
MTELLSALFLGFVEGMTEFIPVSSTAHLILIGKKLEFGTVPGHVFEVFIQLGAILAIVVLYRRKLWHTLLEFRRDKKARLFSFNLALGTVPALAAGALAHDWIKTHLYNHFVIAGALIAGGIFILVLEKKFTSAKITDIDRIPPKTSFLIGCCQMLALVPGISRAGATIMGGLAFGLSRPAAAEFSFFLAIPVMFAAVGYDTVRNWDNILSSGRPELMLAGLAAAFLTALAVIRPALKLINRFGFIPFAWYRIAAGFVILFVFA